MSVQVDQWKLRESQILREVSGDYRNIAHELENTLASLRNINSAIYGSQVSGPPGEHLNGLWNECNPKLTSMVSRINNLSNQLSSQSTNWENSYNDQKRAAEEEAKKEAEAKAKAKKK